MSKPTVFSSGYLLFRGESPKQFLLMRHANRWDLPKGHVDPGETILQAAQRELEEETSLRTADIHTDPVFRFVLEYIVPNERDGTRNALKQLTIFLGYLDVPRPIRPSEHLGFQWFDWAPPHRIQTQTIDALLEAVDAHFQQFPSWPHLESSS